ncbi:hypothetical protein M8C21_031624, partial [Ambrosia artemisiifolia]
MEFVTPIVTPVVESLLVPIKRHMSFLVFSSDKVQEMHAKVIELDGKVRDMLKKRMANNAKGLMEPHHVPIWLAEVEEIKSRVKIIPASRVGCFNIKLRYKRGKQSYDILKVIDRLMKDYANIVWNNERIPLAMVTSPRSSIEEHDDNKNKNSIKSRDLIFNDALKSLKSNDDTTRMMALCGMGGVGKTTIMEQLKQVAKDRKMFDWIVKADVGQNPNSVIVQQTVAEYLGEALTESTKDTKAVRLQKIFEMISEEGKKKILVILDDVWEEFDIKEIGLASPLPNGFKLLLTSRDENVCKSMGVEASSIFRIAILEEPEAKTLFWEISGLISDGDIEIDLHKIGEEIVKGCKGLPIAIKTIASTLRANKEKYVWEDTLFRLRNKEFKVHDIFEISYNNLKDDYSKSIFLLSGLFPDDYAIDIENLLRYAWGLKIFKNVNALAQARSRVKTCVYNLIQSNLLVQSDREGLVKMHDLVRDFVVTNFSKFKQASIMNLDNNAYDQLKEVESYERLLLKCEGIFEFQEDFNHPNLKFLMLMSENEKVKFPGDFYSRLKKLEVLAYKNIDRPVLPQYSTSLRALCLHACSSVNDDISFIGDLVNLEILTLANCGIRNLPSKLGNLKRLKLLDLTGCLGLSIDDGVFMNLVKLEELYMKASTRMPIRFTDGNCDELSMLSKHLSTLEVEFFENKTQLKYVSFEKLKRFSLSMGCLLPYEWSHDSFKNRLKLVTSRRELLECKVNELFEETEMIDLEVDDMQNIEDILVHPPQKSFSHLTSLHISQCLSLEFLFTINVAEGLRNLEVLTIKECPVLKLVVHGENSEIVATSFQKLRTLTLHNLQEMVSLCDCINAIELPQLAELDLGKLPKVTSIFADDNTDIPTNQSFLNKEVLVPNLKELKIANMKNLKEIWSCEINSREEEVCNISTLTVTNCNSITNLFPNNPMRLLSHLKRITVKDCGDIEVVFNVDFDKVQQLSNTSSLEYICLDGLDKLRNVWSIKYAENIDSGFLIRGFHAVKYLYISECERFRNIVTPTTISFDMRSLEEINIQTFIYRQQQEPKEEISEVGALMSIAALPSDENALNFHHLRKVNFYKFQGVEVLFEIESPIKRVQLVTTQQPLTVLPYLEKIRLRSMDNLTHVWKCSNWNEFFILRKHQPRSSSFQNLTTIELWKCPSIKYLFSPLMVKLLSNLKEVKISLCKGMEEVVSNQDEEITHTPTTNLFPLLDLLELSSLDKLKHIGGGVAAKGTTNVSHGQSKLSQIVVVSWSLCQYSKKIRIRGCDALSSVIPSFAAGQTQNLQVLSVESCIPITEAFETKEDKNVGSCSSTTTIIQPESLGTNTAITITRPRNITLHKFPNLKKLKIIGCCHLEYICTFSTFESMKNLEKLTIRDCEAVKVIVREESREQTQTPSSKDVVFPHLKSIELCRLQNLKGFFLGMDIDFQWPLLDYVMINDCPQMMAFTYGKSTAPKLEYIHTKLGKHDLECGINFRVTPMWQETTSLGTYSISSNPIVSQGITWSFHNLIQCNMEGWSYDTKIFPSSELQQLQKLETIHAEWCRNVEEVFEAALEVTDDESQNTVKFHKLRGVELVNMDSLKHLWKSHQWRKLEFPNLTRLSIDGCKSLEYVFTCSMPKEEISEVGALMSIAALPSDENTLNFHQLCKAKFNGFQGVEVLFEIESPSKRDQLVTTQQPLVLLPHLEELSLSHMENLTHVWKCSNWNAFFI